MTDDEGKKHEPARINARRILGATAAVVTMLAAVLVAAGLLLRWLDRQMPPPTTASPQASWQRDSATARVQPNQAAKMRALRHRHQRLLSEYQWIERPKGVARIPIDRAIELLAEQELTVDWSDPTSDEEAP